MTISNWPLNERPREKLLTVGAKNLSDAELLAIFLRCGIKGKTALDLARDLLVEVGSLRKLLSIEAGFFCQKKGVGKAKFAMLKAALELGRRCIENNLEIGSNLPNGTATKQFLQTNLKMYEHEVFACIFLNNQNEILAFEEIFKGTLAEVNVYPREVIKRCLAHNAAKIILAHNHPSGNPTPSRADKELTYSLQAALNFLDIKLLDHIVVGQKECFSFLEAGLC